MESSKQFPWEDLLSEQVLLSSYDPDIREQLIRELLNDEVSTELRYSKDRIIIRQGDVGKSVYMVGAGSARVVLLGESGEEVVTLYTFRKGDTFGEMALFESKARSATVISNTDCTVLRLGGARFLQLIRQHPELEFKILMRLSERLRHTDKQILSVQTKNIDEKLQHFNTKLNAELKVIDASLKASQTVFEQTKMRTDEVISSAERSRSRMTMAASAIGIIISVFGFFGIKELVNVRKLSSAVEKSKVAIDETQVKFKAIRQDIEKTKTEVESIHKDLEARTKEFDASITLSMEFIADRVVIPEFEEALEERNTGAAIAAYELIKKLGLDPSSYEEKQNLLLANIWASMLNQLGKDGMAGLGRSGEGLPEMDFDPLLGMFLEDAARPDVAMRTHFLLLANAAATGSQRFTPYYKRFKQFMEKYSGKGLTEEELANTALIFKGRPAEQQQRFEHVKELIPIDYK